MGHMCRYHGPVPARIVQLGVIPLSITRVWTSSDIAESERWSIKKRNTKLDKYVTKLWQMFVAASV